MLKRHEVLFNQLEETRHWTLELIQSLSEEDADQIPHGFNNNIRWNLGHIFLDQYLWLQHITKETLPIPDGYQDWFGFGTSPATWKYTPPSLEELAQLLRGQIAYIRERYHERLEEEFQPTEMGMHTIAQVLVRTLTHEWLHINTIILLRRFNDLNK